MKIKKKLLKTKFWTLLHFMFFFVKIPKTIKNLLLPALTI